MVRILACIIAVLWAVPAFATTWWVSPAGGQTVCANVDGDTDPGVYMTVAQMDTSNCAAAGDTIMFKAGTYTGTNRNLDTFLPQGTSTSNMSSVLCEGDRTCIIAWSTVISSTSAMLGVLDVNHYRIGSIGHGFKTDCINYSTTAICYGARLGMSDSGASRTNVIIEGNEFVRFTKAAVNTAEKNPGGGYYSNVQVRYNKMNAHGTANLSGGQPPTIYLAGDNDIIEYNDITTFPVAGSLGVQIYHIATGGVIRYNIIRGRQDSSGLLVDDSELGRPGNNRIYGNILTHFPGEFGSSCFTFQGGSDSSEFYNNTCIGWTNFYNIRSGATGNKFWNNVCSVGSAGGSCTRIPGSGNDFGGTATVTNPVVTAASHFKNYAAGDFSLLSTSTLINAGISTAGVVPFSGTLPDIGAHESFAPSSAVVDANHIDITLNMNANTPIVPAGTTGWTVSCSGGTCPVSPTVTSVGLLSGSSSILRLTLSGDCEAGETWTWTYNSTGVHDSANIAGDGTHYQPMFTYATQAVTNSCTGTPPDPPANIEISYAFNEGTGTTANDTEGTNEAGTLTGGATWTTGHTGSGVQLTANSGQYVAVPYGNGVDPSSQSLSVAFGVFVTPGQENANKGYFGATFATNRYFYISTRNGSWCMGIYTSGESACDTALSVSSGWNRLFITADAATDTAVLCRNGITATGTNGTKTYSSYTFPGNFELGRIGGLATGGGGVFDDFRLWTEIVSCSEDYLAWEPPPAPVAGTLSQISHQFAEIRVATGGGTTTYGPASGTVPVAINGAVAVQTTIECTVSNCDPIGVKLWYTRNGGTAQALPNTPTSDEVSFYNTTDPDFIAAFTDDSAAVFDLAQNETYSRYSIIKFTASASGTYCFMERNQNGEALSGYTPANGACVLIVESSLRKGF